MQRGVNFDEAAFHQYYEVNNANRLTESNVTAFLKNFRSEGFDDWGRSYEEVKIGMHHWKAKHFPPNLNEGDSLYESACGIGLNLYMTLEITHEIKGLESLTVYGNEYLPISAEKANLVFDRVPPSSVKKGMICPADSTDLSFIPSNSFDLVYTGYISPLMDPMNLSKGSVDANYAYYTKLCKATDYKSQKLTELAQRIQEDFYGGWVAEMVRITKPGKPVIVEQVSYPYCEEFRDWGGVNQSWWKSSIRKYGWDVDANSIEMEKDTIFHNRYHVFMRKNKEKQR
jgi:hypothetical protein